MSDYDWSDWSDDGFQEYQDASDKTIHNIAKHETTVPNLDIREMSIPSKDADIISDITDELSIQCITSEPDISENRDEHEIHNITKSETTGPHLDIREMTMPSKDADIVSDITDELSVQCIAGETDISENQDEHEIHNITKSQTTGSNLDIRDMTVPSQDADVTQELSNQYIVGETDISENQDEHEIHNIANLETTAPTLDIREMTMPNKDADIICDITQELSDQCTVGGTDISENRDEHEVHNIAKHEMTGPNKDIRDMTLPSQETDMICGITQELSNQCIAGEMDISKNRDEQSCQYGANEIKMPNHEASVRAQNDQGELSNENAIGHCYEIFVNTCKIDQMQHQILDTPIFLMQMEAVLKVSLPLPFLKIQKKKKRKTFHKRQGRKKTTDTTGPENDDSVQTACKYTKQHEKRQTRSRTSKKHSHIGYITSSSDDDIPLANIKFRKKYILEQQDDSDRNETFKPSARDNNSTDTEYSSNLSDTDRNMKKTLLNDFKAANQKEAKAKQKMTIQQTNKSA